MKPLAHRKCARAESWITYAAKECQGWIPSGRYSSWADLAARMRVYREAGGNNGVLANIAIDLGNWPESASLAEVAHVSLICSSDEARQRFKQIEELGFDEVLLVSPTAAVEEIERGATSSRPMLCPHTVIYSNA